MKNHKFNFNEECLSRAQGCLLGQLAGDSLGSLVEFRSPEQILHEYPNGVRELADGGTWNTIAGQPTDDSELALLLSRSLIKHSSYNPDAVFEEYKYWLKSGPFDCGFTISGALQGQLNYDSQANGAMMRVSPLGVFGSKYELEQVAEWAKQDAMLTHPNPVCLHANALYTMAIAFAIKTGCSANDLYQQVLIWSNNMDLDQSLKEIILNAEESTPLDYLHQQGWVLIAFQNALYQLLHAENLEEGVIDTVMRGGDTDTNAAICGALLGAAYGIEAVPKQWQDCILICRPSADNPNVNNPRPESMWPIDALILAEQLMNF